MFRKQMRAIDAFIEIENTLKKADPEHTRSPWWLIIDPKQNFETKDSQALHNIASMIKGPFFSREDAENYLRAHRYNFGKYAKVYCHSGTYSWKYDNLCKALDKV